MSHKRIFSILLLALCWSCAQQGSPTGGARDEDPPVVVESDPPNYSVHFDARRIEVTFDEYVVLGNVNQELVVSPPMEEKPEVRLRKRTMIIQLEDSLKANTTYTFNFGSAIADLHEGNVLLNYEYVFSTGAVLDSLSLKGTLTYAKDLLVPEEPINILLYTDLRDSVPLLDIPRYVGRSNDSGEFSVNNLARAEYKVFALKDANNNFLFDMPSEEIAFLDSTVLLDADLIAAYFDEADTTVADTTVADTTEASLAGADSSQVADSLTLAPGGRSEYAVHVEMRLFTEEVLTQYLMDDARNQRRLIELSFAQPLTDSFYYQFLRPYLGTRVEVLEDYSPMRDSLRLWLTDSLDYKQDSLYLEILYTMRDSLDLPYTQVDTLLFSYRERESRRGRERTPEQEKLNLTSIRSGGKQDLNRPLSIDLNFPFHQVRDSLIHLYAIPDSVEQAAPFTIEADPELPTRVWLRSDWESLMNYRLLLLPGAIQSIYPLDHDTLDVSFGTRDLEYYGQILLNLESVKHPVLVHLMVKDQVVREMRVDSDGLYTFDFLAPGSYTFTFIHDLNDNGRWDTGKYLEGRQPEYVEKITKAISVRSNWDHEVPMRLAY